MRSGVIISGVCTSQSSLATLSGSHCERKADPNCHERSVNKRPVAHSLAGCDRVGASGCRAGRGQVTRATRRSHAADLGETTVAEVMDARPLFVEPQTDLATVVDLMEEWRVRRLPVCQAGRVVGVISRGDLLRALHTRDLAARREWSTAAG